MLSFDLAIWTGAGLAIAALIAILVADDRADAGLPLFPYDPLAPLWWFARCWNRLLGKNVPRPGQDVLGGTGPRITGPGRHRASLPGEVNAPRPGGLDEPPGKRSSAGPGRSCPNCGRPGYHGAVCGRCGWGFGWQPAYETRVAAVFPPGSPPVPAQRAAPPWVQAILDAPIDAVRAGAW